VRVLPGFNHNIKHKGRVYHVQTEDSGTSNPHIITHLFVGGNILASKKTTYHEIVGQDGYEKTVRSMMEEQHKQMLRNLINGVYDTVDPGEYHHLDGPAPLNTDGSSTTASADMMAAPANVAVTAPAGGVPVQASPPTPATVDLPPEVQAVRAMAPEDRPVEKRADTTIFGEDLISEKSLDEVILSYLAEDLADLD
jgi:hypothetical protein